MLKPLHDRVVIRPDKKEEQTRGGIVLPDTAQEKPFKGTVVSVGPGRLSDDGKRIPVPVKPGDKVVFAKYAGTEVTVDGEDYLIVRGDDIYAKD